MGKNNKWSFGRHQKNSSRCGFVKRNQFIGIAGEDFMSIKLMYFRGPEVSTQYLLDSDNDCDNVSIAQVLLLLENMCIG